MNRLDFNENAANFRNLPIQPYTYRTPTPPPITPVSCHLLEVT